MVGRVTVREQCFAQPKSRIRLTLNNCRISDVISKMHLYSDVVVFFGKVDSGSLEIADFFARLCPMDIAKIWCVLCPHELAEKKEYLGKLGFRQNRFFEFSDFHYAKGEQCNEWVPILRLVRQICYQGGDDP